MIRHRWRGPGWRVFEGHPEHGKTVRDWISRVVTSHDCPVDPDDAALVVSELFANALMHGPAGRRVLVGYCLWIGGARIVVCDAGAATRPRLRDPAAMDEGGRGLCVVDSISAQWGSIRLGRARVVWCDLGQPLDAVADDAWTWLAWLLTMVPLTAPGTQPGPVCGAAGRRVGWLSHHVVPAVRATR